MKRWIFAISMAAMLTATNASAEQPYAPKKKAASDLIQRAAYDTVPIRLPDFQVTSTRSVVNGSRLDFEQAYDVNYWDLVEWFEAHYEKREPVSVLDPDVFPHAKTPELLVYGKHNTGNMANFTLGHPDLPYRFQLAIRSDEQSKAVVVIRNAVFSMIYSGLMPARTGFQPAGRVGEIPFRWN